MKKLLLILFIGLLLSCEQEQIVNWNDIMKPMYTDDSGTAQGTIAIVEDEALTDGSLGLALIEYDSVNNYVGTTRGKIDDSNKSLLLGYALFPNSGYYISVNKGSDVNEAGWNANGIQYLENSIQFNFEPILANNPSLTVGGEIAIINVYSDKGKSVLLRTYSLRL